ncbi:hypothetical protein [Nocardioides sp. SYSU DS0651]|uniref:hypothetical protein n=1 Tax=Nocardioides sp. SYSU DS0651 TaxID=3415955 RepID=UPI003F4C0800
MARRHRHLDGTEHTGEPALTADALLVRRPTAPPPALVDVRVLLVAALVASPAAYRTAQGLLSVSEAMTRYLLVALGCVVVSVVIRALWPLVIGTDVTDSSPGSLGTDAAGAGALGSTAGLDGLDGLGSMDGLDGLDGLGALDAGPAAGTGLEQLGQLGQLDELDGFGGFSAFDDLDSLELSPGTREG